MIIAKDLTPNSGLQRENKVPDKRLIPGRWKILGLIMVIIFSINCGIASAVGLLVLTGYTGIFFIPATILGMSTFVAYMWMGKARTPEVLDKMAKNSKKLLANFWLSIRTKLKKLIENPRSDQQLSQELLASRASSKQGIKQLLLGVGIFSSICFGAVNAAVTYGAAFKLLSLVMISISAACPPAAIALAAFMSTVTFICVSTLMISGFINLVKTNNFMQKAKNIWLNLVSYERNKESDPKLSKLRFYPELVAKIFIILACCGLIGIALTASSLTSTSYFYSLLTDVIKASNSVIFAISNIIGMGFALFSQIPFIVEKNILPYLGYFYKSSLQNKKASRIESEYNKLSVRGERKTQFKGSIVVVARAISALGTGFFSMNGQVTPFTVLGAIGNTIGNFNASAEDAKNQNLIENEPAIQSTASIVNKLQIETANSVDNNKLVPVELTFHPASLSRNSLTTHLSEPSQITCTSTGLQQALRLGTA